MLSTGMARRAVGVVSAVVLASGVGGIVGGAAHADPGRCGVSVSGPDNMGAGFVYWVRNQCAQPINVKVHLYDTGQNTACKYIVPGETVPFTELYPSQTWQAVAC